MVGRAGPQEATSTAGQHRVMADFEDLQWGPVENPSHDLGIDLFSPGSGRTTIRPQRDRDGAGEVRGPDVLQRRPGIPCRRRHAAWLVVPGARCHALRGLGAARSATPPRAAPPGHEDLLLGARDKRCSRFDRPRFQDPRSSEPAGHRREPRRPSGGCRNGKGRRPVARHLIHRRCARSSAWAGTSLRDADTAPTRATSERVIRLQPASRPRGSNRSNSHRSPPRPRPLRQGRMQSPTRIGGIGCG